MSDIIGMPYRHMLTPAINRIRTLDTRREELRQIGALFGIVPSPRNDAEYRRWLLTVVEEDRAETAPFFHVAPPR